MSEELKSIHEIDLNIICEYFSLVKRQGPGSPDITLKALSFIDELNENSRIVDLGCGTGGQTMVLAQHIPGQITGIDLFPLFIDIFNSNAKQLGLQDRVKGEIGSMDDLTFQEEELDLIWSEGAIYNIGFERGLKEWRKYLKKGGYIAVSEATWFTSKRPAEIDEFWMSEYPGIDTIPNKVSQMQSAGYVPVATFILPDYCWTENFHKPQDEIRDDFLRKYADNAMAKQIVAYQQRETQLFNKYCEFYGYAFYIGKKL